MQIAEFDRLIDLHPLILVDFWADWCEPCKMLDNILEDLGERMKDDLHILKVDADASEELKERFHMRSVPVLLLFKDNELVWRMNGFMLAGDLQKKILEYADQD